MFTIFVQACTEKSGVTQPLSDETPCLIVVKAKMEGERAPPQRFLPDGAAAPPTEIVCRRPKGPSINDVHRISRFFYSLRPLSASGNKLTL